MSVSSIPSSPPLKLVNYLDASTPQQPPAASADNDADDAGAAQPPSPTPLPPGQGTRVDQLV